MTIFHDFRGKAEVSGNWRFACPVSGAQYALYRLLSGHAGDTGITSTDCGMFQKENQGLNSYPLTQKRVIGIMKKRRFSNELLQPGNDSSIELQQ